MQGIAELITRPGLINVDFADVRTVMAEMGMAMMGSGVATRRRTARGRGRGRDLEPVARGHQPVRRARHPGERDGRHGPAIGEFHEVGDTVKQFASEDATVVDRHGHRSGDEGRDPRDRGRDRPWSGRRGRREADQGGPQGAAAVGRGTAAAARAELQRPREARAYAQAGGGRRRHGHARASRTCSISRPSYGGRRIESPDARRQA